MNRTIRWMGVVGVLLALAGCGKKEAQVVKPRPLQDTEVAVWVDQVGITQGQIQREATRLFSHVPQDTPAERIPELQVRMLSQAVDNLVVRQLVKAEMERSGVLISQAELDQGKQDLEKGLGEGHSLAMLLAAANLSVEELEGNLRLDLFKNKVLKDKVDAAFAEITDEAVQAYYEENVENFTIPEGRVASHILVRVAPTADEAVRADSLAKAEGIRKALVEGADFEGLAREVSQCASRTRGGALGVIPRGREAPAFEEAVFSQAFGEIGEVVESPVGFHVIRVDSEQDEKVIPFEEIQNRLRAQMRSRAQQQITAEYIKELREKATIKLDGALAEAAAAAEAAQQEQGVATEAPAVTAP
jgi:peptidyl-prolyl cis-trans isomerase C